MRPSALKLTAVILLFSGFTFHASAQKLNVVTTAVPFLRISPDARTGGMGEVGIATSPDANSGLFNLAKIPFSELRGGIGLTYTPWLKDLGLNDVYLASLAGYYKIDELQAVNGSLRYFSLGNIQFTDAAGNDLNTFSPKEFGIDVGYSRKLADKVGLGIALKYIHSNLAGNVPATGQTFKAGNSVAGDIAVYYDGKAAGGSGWSLGAAATNLGAKIAYTDNADQKDFIPANIGVGAAYTTVFNEQNKLTFAMDLNKLLVPTPPADGDSAGLVAYRQKSVVGSWFSSFSDAPGGFSEEIREVQIAIGAEYWYNNQFALRAGYFWEDETKGNRKYFTMGVGIKYNIFGLNFSYLLPSGSGVNRNPLSNTLRFSLLFDLDGNSGESSTK